MSDPKIISEGKCVIKLPEGVFYNRVQEFNRDLTIAMIRHYQKIHKYEWINKAKSKLQNPTTSFSKEYVGLRILEALAASGIRSVRFSLEIPFVSNVVANDIDEKAVQLIQENARLNNIGDMLTISCNDAVDLMHQHRVYEKRFNVVDLDPYGTVSPFLDSAISCLHDGGLLCVTSTDMAVLCGSTPGTAMGKYGGMAVKNSATAETGLRILLHAIQSAAGRHSRVIEPLLSLSIDFYARVFVRVWSSPSSVKAIASKHAICYSCSGCRAYHMQPLGKAITGPKCVAPATSIPVGPNCSECGSVFNVWGPLWIGPLHSRSFIFSFLSEFGSPPKDDFSVISKPEMSEDEFGSSTVVRRDFCSRSYSVGEALNIPLPTSLSIEPSLSPFLIDDVQKHFGTHKRIVGMCTMAYEELPDIVLYHKLDALTSVLGSTMPRMVDLHSAFLNSGYRISSSHAETNCFKTDASMSFIWDVLLSFARQQGIPAPTVISTGGARSSIECNLNQSGHHKKKRRLRSHSPVDESNEGEESRQTNYENVRSRLFSRPPNDSILFDTHPLANPPSREAGLVRYQVKPEKSWGPKSRPKMNTSHVAS